MIIINKAFLLGIFIEFFLIVSLVMIVRFSLINGQIKKDYKVVSKLTLWLSALFISISMILVYFACFSNNITGL